MRARKAARDSLWPVFFVDALDDALGNGFLDGNGVETPAHGVAVLGDGADEFEENGGEAAVSGNDGELAAPGGDGFGDAIEEALIFVESEFVESDVAAFAREGVGIRGERIDTMAISELEDVGGGIRFVVEEHFAFIAEADVHEAGPVAAVVQLETCLVEVAGGDVGVEPGVLGADEEVEAVAVAPGEAGLAGFDDDFEGGIVVDPVALGFVKELFGIGVHIFLKLIMV
jgi:hypothetical protein